MSARLAAFTAVVALALLAAGCGGGGGGGGGATGSVPEGASIAPKGSALFVSVNTDFESEQWKQTAALFDKFPGGPALLAQAQKELKGFGLSGLKTALGQELDVALLGFGRGGDTVTMTKPTDPAKLKALLAKSEPNSVSEDVEGWTVVADSKAQLARFDTARKDGVLSDSDAFTEAMQQLPDAAAVKLYVDGGQAQAALQKSLQGGGIPSGSTSGLGSLQSIAAAAVAETNGISLDGDIAASVKSKTDTYAPELPSVLPSGALVLVSFAHLDSPLRRAYKALERAQPNLEKQLNLFQGVAGLSVEGDLLPILAGEGAIVVYPSGPGEKIPGVALVLKLDDEAKVKSLLDRLATVLSVSGSVKVTSTSVGGVPVKKFDVQGVTVLAGVLNGMLVITNAESVMTGVQSNGDKLADEPQYSQAAADAGLPDKVLGFTYVDLKDGLADAFALVDQYGQTVPPEARANAKPLQSLLVYATGGSDRYSVGGFLTIK